MEPLIAAQPSEHWLAGLEKCNVSCGPINDLAQVFDDPHVQARGMHLQMDHPATGNAPVDLVASPMKMSATPPDYRRPPPMLGQHTDEVIRELLDVGDDELAALRAEGVI